MKTKQIHFSFLIVLMGLLLNPSSVFAKDYLVEIVLFETVAGRTGTAGGLFLPKMGRSLRLGTADAVKAGFLEVKDGLTLTENVQSIRESSRYRLLSHFAWRQPGLDDKSAIPIRVTLGGTSKIYLPSNLQAYEEFIPASPNATPSRSRQINTSTINGTIKVRLGRFLHMEALLTYTDPDTQQSFRLSQSRKMRSKELHYIDNPRFGILTRILPLDDTVGPDGKIISAPE